MPTREWIHETSGKREFAYFIPIASRDNTCMQFPDGWWLHDAPGYDESGQVAGPFPTLDACKAAFILMWGT